MVFKARIANTVISYDFFYIILLLTGVLILSLCDTFMLKVLHPVLFGYKISIAFSGALFPFGLIISNAIVERYSTAHSYFFVLTLVSFQFLYSGSSVLVSYLPSEHYASYAELYQHNGMICIGGTLGILAGYLMNHHSIKLIANLFDYIPLLARDFVSNVLSKFFICFFSYFFIFYNMKTVADIWSLILYTWLLKIVIGAVIVPAVVPLVKYISHIKRSERNTDLNYN